MALLMLSGGLHANGGARGNSPRQTRSGRVPMVAKGSKE
ncbi:hypothetical protein GFS60_08066 (plasmid) [Rhodococcus sp. WAY2]|nr:hypothetical protein GFS60_08066 [Rhodococcus sp. WAY2]